MKGNAEICQALLAHGANPDLVYASVWTPLLLASRLGRMTILELLLQYGADPNFPNSQGFTALHVAVGRDHCFVGMNFFKTMISIIHFDNVKKQNNIYNVIENKCKFCHLFLFLFYRSKIIRKWCKYKFSK